MKERELPREATGENSETFKWSESRQNFLSIWQADSTLVDEENIFMPHSVGGRSMSNETQSN